MTIRRQLLEHAARLIDGDRNDTYGEPADDFARIAGYWNTYLTARTGRPIRLEPHDIGLLMALLKIARLSNQPAHTDSYVDLAGYAACAYECVRQER